MLSNDVDVCLSNHSLFWFHLFLTDQRALLWWKQLKINLVHLMTRHNSFDTLDDLSKLYIIKHKMCNTVARKYYLNKVDGLKFLHQTIKYFTDLSILARASVLLLYWLSGLIKSYLMVITIQILTHLESIVVCIRMILSININSYYNIGNWEHSTKYLQARRAWVRYVVRTSGNAVDIVWRRVSRTIIIVISHVSDTKNGVANK